MDTTKITSVPLKTVYPEQNSIRTFSEINNDYLFIAFFVFSTFFYSYYIFMSLSQLMQFN